MRRSVRYVVMFKEHHPELIREHLTTMHPEQTCDTNGEITSNTILMVDDMF